ncbi:exodeoxyribonuclease VII large subunit [Patescibacteria group bacterium]|nr:exodeoxyribonuclease VII large subunit [Patescibacteria group bacterium]
MEFQRDEEHIFSVSSYLDVLNQILTTEKVQVQGEISSMKAYPKAIYFSMKDKEDGSILSCIIFKWQYSQSGIRIEEGMEVKVSGVPNIYKPTGRFTFIADKIEPVGEGALKKAYDLLKAQLDKEGLFARKREIPDFVERVGIISSKQGVVIQDFLNNLAPLGFQIFFYDSRVEGPEAIQSVVKGVEWFNSNMPDLDALIIMRGGGDLESLQAFNNELVARAVFASNIPIIAAIGHDVDVPITSLVADRKESTPTAAATLLNQSWDPLIKGLPVLERDLINSFEASIIDARNNLRFLSEQIFSRLERVFTSFETLVARLIVFKEQLIEKVQVSKEQVYLFQKQLLKNMEDSLRKQYQFLESTEKYLAIASPERNLELGYSVVVNDRGEVIKDVEDVEVGETVVTRLHKGEFDSRVQHIKKK